MKIKLTKQLDETDCGAACLQMISDSYGHKESLISIKDKIYVSIYGVSMLNIARGEEAMGFKTLSVMASLKFIKQEKPFPCIIHVNSNHFVVLYDVKYNCITGKYTYYIADPAYGKVKMTEEEFSSEWLADDNMGIALLVSPRDEFEQMREKSRDSSSIWMLLKYFKPFKRYYPTIFLGLLGASAITFILPFMMQLIVDEGVSNKDISIVAIILIAQVVILLGQLIMNYIRGLMLLHINVRIGISIISDFLMKLMRIPIRFFDAKSQSDVFQRINDHSVVEHFLTDNMLNAVFSLLNILVFSIFLCYYGIEYLAVFLIGGGISLFWTWTFNKKRKKINYIRFQRSRDCQDAIFEILNGMSEIKLNNNDLQRRWEWEKAQAKLFKLNLIDLKLGQFQRLGDFFFTQLKNAIIIFYAALAVIHGDITIGMMMSISFIIGSLNSPLEQLTLLIQTWQDAKLSMERLMELQSVNDEYTKTDIQKGLNTNIDISIKDLCFSYDGSREKMLLKDICMDIRNGQSIAIVGASGCGKTTLIKLILGYYQPQTGCIKINNVNLEDISLRQWRDDVGCVLQDGYIFSDSVQNNITMQKDMDRDLLEYALKISNCDEFVRGLPFGLETKIGPSGMNLSAGQKQRILIARAVYKNPSIIIFDEATSSLDDKNEAEISSKLYDFFRHRTAIIIAHRLSTIKNVDRIYVMDKGTFVEIGTHKELVSKGGIYYNLIQNQLV